MNKICFLAVSPFTKRDYERFGIAEIQKQGYQVLILDCTPFLESSFDKKVNGESICVKFKNCIRCYSIYDLFKNLLKFKPDWCVDFLEGYSKKKYLQRVLIRIFLKSISKIVLYRLGAHPYYSSLINDGFISKIKNKIKISIVSALSLPWKIFNADKIVVGGSNINELYKIKNYQKIIFAHNLDFDNYKKVILKKDLLEQEKNILFLDEDFPCHTDYEREGLGPNIDELTYFREISNCLKIIGNKFNLNPYIKLHPKANFEKSKSLYDIDITTEDTAEFIYKSNLVIAHCSTAIQLAVLFYKPIILIKPNDLAENSPWYLTLERFGKFLDLQSFKSKDIYNLKVLPKVNKKKYDLYIEQFIKIRSSKNLFSWEIILEELFL